MKAWVLSDIGQIEYKEVNDPVLNERECMIKPKAFGVCGSDIPRIYKTGAHISPIIPGHEFAGEVVSVNNDSIYKKGDRVAVFPLIPCQKCKQCTSHKYEMCENYSYLGSRCNGGFAEYVAVPEWNLIKIPDNVSYETAALAEPLSVAIHAVRRAIADKSSDSTVYVQGLGTVGLLTTMVLRSFGFNRIFVAGNKKFQKDIVLSLGLPEDNYLDVSDLKVKDNIFSKTGMSGAEIVFECVGKSESFETCTAVCAAGGVLMLIGNPASDMTLTRNVYWNILRHQLTVYGTWNSSFFKEENDDWHLAIRFMSEHGSELNKLITHRFTLSDIYKGFEIMRDKREDYIKVMGVSE